MKNKILIMAITLFSFHVHAEDIRCVARFKASKGNEYASSDIIVTGYAGPASGKPLKIKIYSNIGWVKTLKGKGWILFNMRNWVHFHANYQEEGHKFSVEAMYDAQVGNYVGQLSWTIWGTERLLPMRCAALRKQYF